MSTTVKFPEAKMRLVGEDGNAFSIMGRAAKALRSAGATKEQVDAYTAEAMSGDYNHLLRTTMEWVACDTDLDEADDCEECGMPEWDCDCCPECECYECECDE